MDYAIETKDLSVCFSSRKTTVKAVDNLNLHVNTGHVFGFLGPNGAGKTTTMSVLLGFVPPSSGEAYLLGENVLHHIARTRIGYLTEHPDTYRFLTGIELLDVTGRLFKMEKKKIRQRTEEVLAQVDLIDAARRRISTYSRGMLQRICLAQALINDPDLIILDEPTSGLDPFGKAHVRSIIADLRSRGKTVFFSSHELSEVELVCDSLAIIVDGRIIREGPSASIIPPGENLEKFFMKTVTEFKTGPASLSGGGRK